MSAGTISRICEICKTTFFVFPSRLKQKSGGTCCSLPCSVIRRGITLSRESPRITCLVCGELFRVKPSHQARAPRRHCSRACAAIGRANEAASTTSDRFWLRVDKNGPVVRPELGPCWLWLGGATENGYGTFYRSANEPPIRAHRFAWFIEHGTWPELCALHHCDVRRCVNPGHLFEGDRTDNADDRHAKGRDSRGEGRWSAKLTESDVLEIRQLAANGLSHEELATLYPVERRSISKVIRGERWKHI